MKRLTPILSLLLIPLLMSPVHALAAETDKPQSHVSITVVMPEATKPAETQPEPEPTQTPVTAPPAPKLYPTGVLETQEKGKREIIKTYELSPGENPADIPRDSFERDGWSYFLTDITKKETAAADTREHTEVVTLNTDTKDMDAILRQLAQTLEFTSEDGYTGILTLNVASITVETAGTKKSSYTVSATREYPHLSSNDTSLVPKTITDGGRTLTLASVNWKTQSGMSVDYDQIPASYTAVATYTAAASKTVVTGYVTTAEYKGFLSKLNQGRTIYTAYFLGAAGDPTKSPDFVGRGGATKRADTADLSAVELSEVCDDEPERSPLEIIEPTPDPEQKTDKDTDADTSVTEQPAETEHPSETGMPEEQASDAEANPLPLIILSTVFALLLGAGVGYFIPRIVQNKKSKGESDA